MSRSRLINDFQNGKKLVNLNAYEVNMIDPVWKCNLLHMVSTNHAYDLIDDLLDLSFLDINLVEPFYKCTALHNFVGNSQSYPTDESRELLIVKKFLDRGADPNIRDKFGSTVLYYALQRRKYESIVELLKSRGAIL